MTRLLGILIVVVVIVGGAWYYLRIVQVSNPSVAARGPSADAWLDGLYSQNPREVEMASAEVSELGARAVPAIQETLRDQKAEAERLKAALKACGILGPIAAPAIREVASVLTEPGLTAEAAIALSYLGRDALPPLRDALSSDDPVVRREALRSIGKLKDRAPLELRVVLPLLIGGMTDRDASVRAVAATYLGIIHEGDEDALPALVAGLSDPDPEVRRAAAAALGSFSGAGEPELAALRKASTDRNDDVAHEAGRSIVKLQALKERRR